MNCRADATRIGNGRVTDTSPVIRPPARRVDRRARYDPGSVRLGDLAGDDISVVSLAWPPRLRRTR